LKGHQPIYCNLNTFLIYYLLLLEKKLSEVYQAEGRHAGWTNFLKSLQILK
jgi:hypothetical protein